MGAECTTHVATSSIVKQAESGVCTYCTQYWLPWHHILDVSPTTYIVSAMDSPLSLGVAVQVLIH